MLRVLGNSRELPDAAFSTDEVQGSFDSPLLSFARSGHAQDDKSYALLPGVTASIDAGSSAC